MRPYAPREIHAASGGQGSAGSGENRPGNSRRQRGVAGRGEIPADEHRRCQRSAGWGESWPGEHPPGLGWPGSGEKWPDVGRRGLGPLRSGNSRPGYGHRPPRLGFTLIEVIITLVIIGIMAASAIPALLGDDRRSDIELARASLEALFGSARDTAVLSAREVLLTVDSLTGTVWFETRGWSGGPPAGFAEDTGGSLGGLRQIGAPRLSSGFSTLGSEVPPLPGREVALDLPATIRMEVPRARSVFLFSPGGSVMGDSIVLRDSGGRIVPVRLDPWNGRVHEN